MFPTAQENQYGSLSYATFQCQYYFRVLPSNMY
uniref:Uncharacterized protein n=1 Tax=Arundo donax TaxID=35708 RepID=A0A0A9FVH7_ARUDO